MTFTDSGAGGGCPVAVRRGVPVVQAPAEIDIDSARRLRDALLESLAGGHATIVADLSRTRFCDSAGLQALVRAHREAVAEGGELRMVLPAARVMRVFAVTGLDRVIPRYATLDEALAPTPAISIRPRRPAGASGSAA
jgi:anti-sigma B factor antagonist